MSDNNERDTCGIENYLLMPDTLPEPYADDIADTTQYGRLEKENGRYVNKDSKN